jgi:hypothetical protein
MISMSRGKIIGSVAAVVCVLLLMPAICSATTESIETTEFVFTYLNDQTRFRYWYKGDTLKHDLVLTKIVEYDGEKIVKQVVLRESDVDRFSLTVEDNELHYKFDERPSGKPLVYVQIKVDMNYFDVIIGLASWTKQQESNQIKLLMTEDVEQTSVVLEQEWSAWTKVVQNSEELTEFYIPVANLGISLFNVLGTLVAIIIASIALLKKR